MEGVHSSNSGQENEGTSSCHDLIQVAMATHNTLKKDCSIYSQVYQLVN